MSVKPPRESMKDARYWASIDSVLVDARNVDLLIDNYRDELTRNQERFFPLVQNGFLLNLEAICYRFSAGDSLDTIRETALSPALDSVNFVLDQVQSDGKKLQLGYLFHPVGNAFALHNVYCTLCWLTCFDVDRQVMERLAPLLAASGQDRLVDVVLRQYQADRVIANGSASPAVFGLIDRLLNVSGDEAQHVVLEHLDSWAEKVRLIVRGRGIGGASHAVLAQSNKDLFDPEIVDGISAGTDNAFKGFSGWWAWEVALAVKVLGIDDAEFVDHALYPVEMVRYKGRVGTDCPWPLNTEELRMYEVVVEPPDVKSTVAGNVRSLTEIAEEIGMIEREFVDGKQATSGQIDRLQVIYQEVHVRTDAEAWVPLLLGLIERTPDSVCLDVWGLLHTLESTWPVYLDELYKSIERQPRGLSVEIADVAIGEDDEMIEKWRPLLMSVIENPDASVGAREVASMTLGLL